MYGFVLMRRVVPPTCKCKLTRLMKQRRRSRAFELLEGLLHVWNWKWCYHWQFPYNVNKKIQLDATVCRHLFTAKSLYMFRASQRPSSGVLKTVTATSGIGHNTGVATSFKHGLSQDYSWSDHVGHLTCHILYVSRYFSTSKQEQNMAAIHSSGSIPSQ
jgi:hypothetical protein